MTACALETPSPGFTPTPPPTAAPTLPGGATTAPGQTLTTEPTPAPGQTLATEPTPAFGDAPVKQSVNIRGVSIPQYSKAPPLTIDVTAKYTATIRTNLGTMVVELLAEQAPITVNSFVFLANDGFYDGIVFHRVIPDFMIQSGDPTGTGFEGPGYRFQDEFVESLTFDQPGYLAMANSGPGTNGSQFFVTTVPTPHLNGRHTIFGRITDGQDVADAISVTQTEAGNRPVTPVVIQGIDITKGS